MGQKNRSLAAKALKASVQRRYGVGVTPKKVWSIDATPAPKVQAFKVPKGWKPEYQLYRDGALVG